FATTNAYIAGRHIGIWSNVAKKFSHVRLAKAHNFTVGFSFWAEIGTAFSTTHGQCGKTVFKSLFKSQKLQNTEGNTCVETKAAFVPTKGRVEFDTVTAVYPDFSLIVDPRNTKHNNPFRFNHPLKNTGFLISRILLVIIPHRTNNFFNCLMKFIFSGSSLLKACNKIIYACFHLINVLNV